MKNKLGLFGVIALTAVIGFSMTGCPMNGNGGDDYNGTPPVLTGTVSITGIPAVGEELTAVHNLVGDGAISFEWRRDTGTDIIGTGETYEVREADLGSTITVTVRREGFSGSIVSNPTARVTPAVTQVPGADLASQLAWLHSNAESGGLYLVEVTGNPQLAPHRLDFDDRSDITVILRGDGQMRTISLSRSGSLFTVYSGVTLVLDVNITLEGITDNDHPLVFVPHGGSLSMNEGARIIGNSNRNEHSRAGGVWVYAGGVFNMYGGTIANNHAMGWPGGGGVVVSGPGHADARFTMRGGTITGNTTEWQGGGVAIYHGTFDMYGGSVTGNTSVSDGGGVFAVYNGTFAMHGGAISNNNTTEGVGGGVALRGEGSSFTMHGGEISGHTTVGSGGAVNVHGLGTFTMHGGDILGNTAHTGGGVYVGWNGTFDMYGGTISNSITTGWPGGGGVTVRGEASSFTMHGGAISGNTSLPIAGGVSIEGGTFTMYGGAISGNTANPNADDWSSGGGVRVASGTFTMYGGEISNNTAASDFGGWTAGGGLTVATTSTFTMRGGTISDNKASAGAGVRVEGNSTFTMQNGGIFENTASQNGGAVNVGADSTFTMQNGEIFENTASQNGGAVNVGADSTFTMQNGEIFGNTALQGGGAVNVGPGSTFAMHGGEIFDNTARTAGAVNVWIGTFYMHNGTISGNTAEQFGGGVVVDGDLEAGNPGRFTLNDGEISSNTATVFSGGGVHIGWNGIFDMRGGRIVGNEVTADEAPPPDENRDTSNGDGLPPIWGGGGVANGNIFNMHGGEISSNTAQYGGGLLNFGTGNNMGVFQIGNGVIHGVDEHALGNTARAEGPVLFNMHMAHFGTFDDAGAFTPEGELHTRDITLQVVNGSLQ